MEFECELSHARNFVRDSGLNYYLMLSLADGDGKTEGMIRLQSPSSYVNVRHFSERVRTRRCLIITVLAHRHSI